MACFDKQWNLPIRALHEIREFSRPLTRPDWRKCKRDEADLIWCHMGCINDHDELYWNDGWTLYGKEWYLTTNMLLHANREPLRPPPPFEVYDREYERFEYPCHWESYRTDFSRIKRWYQKRAQWING